MDKTEKIRVIEVWEKEGVTVDRQEGIGFRDRERREDFGREGELWI